MSPLEAIFVMRFSMLTNSRRWEPRGRRGSWRLHCGHRYNRWRCLNVSDFAGNHGADKTDVVIDGLIFPPMLLTTTEATPYFWG